MNNRDGVEKSAPFLLSGKPNSEYYDEYADKVTDLLDDFPLGVPIIGEAVQKAFIILFGGSETS